MVRALVFYSGEPGSIPTAGVRCFQLCFIPLLRLSCRKNCKMSYATAYNGVLTLKALSEIVSDDILFFFIFLSFFFVKENKSSMLDRRFIKLSFCWICDEHLKG